LFGKSVEVSTYNSHSSDKAVLRPHCLICCRFIWCQSWTAPGEYTGNLWLLAAAWRPHRYSIRYALYCPFCANM